MKHKLLAFACAAALSAGTMAVAQAQPDNGYYDNDNGYNNDNRYNNDNGYNDQGYYRGGYYRHHHHHGYYDSDNYDRDGRDGYYRSGWNCNNGNVAAGTIFGALGGGLIGGAASHGNGGAVIGGAVLGGLLGNTLSRNMSCEDQRYVVNSYYSGLQGPIGERHWWRHGPYHGYVVADREYTRDGRECRDFTAVTFYNGDEHDRSGTACRREDGNWHFRP